MATISRVHLRINRDVRSSGQTRATGRLARSSGMLAGMGRHYFAYGSNMSSARLLARVPNAQVHGAARLADWRLRFDKPSRDGSAKANVAPETGGVVWGVVWQIPAPDWSVLDAFEPGYERRRAEIVDVSGLAITAQLYVYSGPRSTADPFEQYVAHLTEGAREHALPAEYRNRLHALARRLRAGPDTGRSGR